MVPPSFGRHSKSRRALAEAVTGSPWQSGDPSSEIRSTAQLPSDVRRRGRGGSQPMACPLFRLPCPPTLLVRSLSCIVYSTAMSLSKNVFQEVTAGPGVPIGSTTYESRLSRPADCFTVPVSTHGQH